MSHDVATGVSMGTLRGELRALADADCGIATINLCRYRLSPLCVLSFCEASQGFRLSNLMNLNTKNIEKYVSLLTSLFLLSRSLLNVFFFFVLCFYKGVNFIKLLLSFLLIYLQFGVLQFITKLFNNVPSR